MNHFVIEVFDWTVNQDNWISVSSLSLVQFKYHVLTLKGSSNCRYFFVGFCFILLSGVLDFLCTKKEMRLIDFDEHFHCDHEEEHLPFLFQLAPERKALQWICDDDDDDIYILYQRQLFARQTLHLIINVIFLIKIILVFFIHFESLFVVVGAAAAAAAASGLFICLVFFSLFSRLIHFIF